ncbi:MAG: phosphoribosylglycinamide formyltransferase [Burkholderiales bacterium]|nr:phosphoribosylglycinamide formyltransferase [Burkholderiales bacterium]
MNRIVVLISGRGSNLGALLDAGLPVVAVFSNRPNVAGLELAQSHGVPTRVIDHRAFDGREAFDGVLADAIDAYTPDLVVLAGFLRVLTGAFVQRFAGRLLNIHPSLLPAFPGLNTHRRALEAGVKIHGCTVHFVTEALDHGPIVAQAAVPVLSGDTESLLAARVLAEEHRILPAAVRWFLEGRLRIEQDAVHLTPPPPLETSPLLNPMPA